MHQNKMEVHQNKTELWKVSLVDTGKGTMTGGRIKRVRKHIGSEAFCLTFAIWQYTRCELGVQDAPSINQDTIIGPYAKGEKETIADLCRKESESTQSSTNESDYKASPYNLEKLDAYAPTKTFT